MYGFDSKTGNILWGFNSKGAVNSGAAISDGIVYWVSGYSRFNLGAGNNKLYVEMNGADNQKKSHYDCNFNTDIFTKSVFCTYVYKSKIISPAQELLLFV
jgi:outer membrane protein assembly factor BamB